MSGSEAKSRAPETPRGSDQTWAEFWSGTHSIYVNARHAQVHYARIARDLIALISRRDRPVVLDWGCGDALNAPAIVSSCRELLLYDAVGPVQQRIMNRFVGRDGIRVLSDADWHALAPASVDIVIVVSVVQYLKQDELERLLDDFRRVLRPDGEVIFADIIPPDAGMVADIASLLGTALVHGFFLAACAGLARTFFSEYRRLRATAGFSCYDENEFKALLARHGFAAERLAENVGFNQQRMTFRARPSASA